MLACHTSMDLAELRAFEMRNGPIGSLYADETLASLHEQLQRLCTILVAVNSKSPEGAPGVVHYPRPHEISGIDEE